MRRVKLIPLLLLALLAGCVTPLYETRDGVSIYLVGEPTVERDYYRIEFKFETPTDDPHLIQWIELNGWTGVEVFTPRLFERTVVDHHYPSRGTKEQYRRMLIAPGKVVGVDMTTGGFGMLPSEWPEGFNPDYRKGHVIRGRVVYRKPEFETVYRLDFKDGRLVWSVEGTDIRRKWTVDSESTDGD
jgi:hypothetical protein